ncbi:MAG: tetratricopeptide repeat protein [Candidatus Obscuribacterales bacterium]|nr:tetratricopeptide repeat protein [Candidatus Obscuribacterales bacterium]
MNRSAKKSILKRLSLASLVTIISGQYAVAADNAVLPIKKISASQAQELMVEFASNSFPTAPQVLDLPGPNHRVVIDFADASLDKGSVAGAEELSKQISKLIPYVKAVRYQELENAPKPTARVVVELPEDLKVKPRVLKLEEGRVLISFSDQPISFTQASPAAQEAAAPAESSPAVDTANQLRPSIPETDGATADSGKTELAPSTADASDDKQPVPAGKIKLEDGTVVNVKLESVRRYNSAVQLHLSGKLSDAIAAYKEALEVNASLAEAHSNLGLIYNQQHNYAQALAEFRKALAINPKDAITYNGIGAALRAEHDLQGAIKNWQTAVSLDQKLATAHYNLGTAYEIEKDYEKALSSYRLAVKNDYRLGEAYYRMGLILERKHKAEEAAEQFKEALKVSSDSEYSEDARQRLVFLQGKKGKTQ